ncbi:hypothetical protein K458DRAFT_384119 [Lentithecium fluviatile CBS 122367]|uniref:Uncharacterized protein n=1 Tax=Lentithecium fluviatile CBS 122367 TaxID=1168545 RepID=A0A6G1JGB1_9PLEO|nr:hypothetical protein K458DRAFT_384119 [Lentithecium fluviatile CBS 122367]
MQSVYHLCRELQPSDLRKTARDTLKSAFIAPVVYLKEHPELGAQYVLSLAGSTLAGPLIGLLPLGPLGSILRLLVSSFARFKLRQKAAGSYYALLHLAGFAGVAGQVVSLGTVFGSTGEAAQSWFTSLILSTVGLQAPLIGLALSVLTSFTGCFGVLPSLVGSSDASILINEISSFTIFQCLGWGLKEVETFWRQSLHTTWHSWGKGEDINGDHEKVGKKQSRKWNILRCTIDKIGSHFRQLPQTNEALDEWEMLSRTSKKDKDTETAPFIRSDIPEPATNDHIRAWLEDLNWDDATVCDEEGFEEVEARI